MEHLLYQLVATLLSAHAPWWLLAIVVGTIAVDRIVDRIAIAIDRIGPIRLNLSIGNSTARRRSIDRPGQTHLNCYMREGFGLIGWGDEQSPEAFCRFA
jgi:hypothetical protein